MGRPVSRVFAADARPSIQRLEAHFCTGVWRCLCDPRRPLLGTADHAACAAGGQRFQVHSVSDSSQEREVGLARGLGQVIRLCTRLTVRISAWRDGQSWLRSIIIQRGAKQMFGWVGHFILSGLASTPTDLSL